MASTSWLSTLAAAFLIVAATVPPVSADNGVVLINQSKVVASGGFPYKITSAGSYRLAGNLTVKTAVDGIDVSAAPVTIDLNGFAIEGPSSPGANSAIQGSTGTLTVFKGSLQGFSNGLFVSAGPVSLHDVSISNVGVGFSTTGTPGGQLINVNVQGTNGISCQGDCLVVDCNVSATVQPLFAAFGRLVAMNNILTGGFGVTTSLESGIILGNTIANVGGPNFIGIDVTVSGVVGYGSNVINTGGTTCFSGGTSLGDNICDGTKQ
jgi:hypothetical protein